MGWLSKVFGGAAKFDETRLHRAAQMGRLETMESLLKSGINVDAKDEIGATPLCSAAMNGRVEIVKLLLANRADVNAATADGRTILIWAVQRGHREIAKLLLDKGADVVGADQGDPYDLSVHAYDLKRTRQAALDRLREWGLK